MPTPFFSILDSDDQQKMLHAIIQRSGLQKQFTAKNVAYQISQMKNHTIDPNYPATEYLGNPMLCDIYNAYEKEKRESKCLDFDDLLLETLRLLKKNSIIKNLFQERIQHILVDEYQDTNKVQHELLKTMALCDDNLAIQSICAVGDEDQSIYSWRGATVANMANFKTVFPQTAVITIDQNYRSAQEILTLANATIQNNTQRTPKNLWSEKQGNNRTLKVTCLTEYQESRTIAQLLLVAKEKYGLSNIGILYRIHTQSRALEEALLKESIPYRIIGGIQFYERKEIKDLLAYLKIIANPFDRTSFFRIINVPARGLGDKFETSFYEEWSQQPFATWQDMIAYYRESNFSKSKDEILKEFSAIVEDLTPDTLTSTALEQIIIRSQYISYIKRTEETTEAQARVENITEFMQAIKHFESNGIKTISAFLDEVALMQDKMSKQNRNTQAVSLMTLHAAKGLEFDLVILPGLEEGLLPTTRSVNSTENLEEERRLFYVGITRAKENLLITHAKHRYSYGQMMDQIPSRFIQEISSKLLPQEDGSYWNNAQAHSFFRNWLQTKSLTRESEIYIPTFSSLTNNAKKNSSTVAKERVALVGNKITNNIPSNTSGWKKNQPVQHKKYGIGTIQEIEEKSNGETHLTIRFKIGIKKITSQFLQKV